MELGKQQEPKTRAMFAAVAAETWGRTGQGKKAVELLDVFNPEDPEIGEMRFRCGARAPSPRQGRGT